MWLRINGEGESGDGCKSPAVRLEHRFAVSNVSVSSIVLGPRDEGAYGSMAIR